MLAGRPIAANSESSAPASAGELPAMSCRIDGSHANIAYALMPGIVNRIASAQASGDRTAYRSRPGSASSGRSAAVARCGRARSAIHGTSARAATNAHSPSETRQPAASATGTATSGGVNDATAMVVE